jgi:hypothetical protein
MERVDDERSAERARVLALLRRYGWNATSFQTLEAGFRYWFDGDDACVAYVETGGAWVAAGAPIAPRERLDAVAAAFGRAARAAGKRWAFFGAESRLLESSSLADMRIGEQPIWDPRRWAEESVKRSRNLREQLRRARAKGVVVRRVDAAELADGAPLRAAILIVALFSLTMRWRHWLGAATAFAISLDAVLTTAEVALYNASRAHTLWDVALLAIAVLGPAIAAPVLWGAVGHRRSAAITDRTRGTPGYRRRSTRSRCTGRSR